jgi:hypothetical protein
VLLLVHRLTNSALLTSLLGALADRVNRKPLIVCCDLTNVVLLGSIPLAAAFQGLTIVHLYAVSLLSAVAFVWFDAANFEVLPAIVGGEQIVGANSVLTSVENFLVIVGPSIESGKKRHSGR